MSLSKRLTLVALTAVLVSFTGISGLWAQTDRGTITGNVTDPSRCCDFWRHRDCNPYGHRG